MRRVLGLAVAAGAMALGALAQDTEVRADQLKMEIQKMTAEAKVIGVTGGVMGPAVKGAPYSADETRESTQVLGDGTRIHNEAKTTVYRDSQGRVRRETPNEISIWDPDAGVNYVLNPKTMIARKMALTYVVHDSSGADAGQTLTLRFNTLSEMGSPAAMAARKFEGGGGSVTTSLRRPAGKKESLGARMMEGVNAEGDLITSTLDTGVIGNDRPIQSTSERWFSPELQTVVMTRRNDPRSGEEIFKLTNIHRGEQAPVLFEVPPGYTIK